MNYKFGLLLVVSIALSSALTYWIVSSQSNVRGGAGLSKEEVRSVVDEYLEDSPETFYAAVVRGMEKQEQAAQEKKRENILGRIDELEHDPATPFGGNAKGDVSIVIFTDYNCGYCKRAAPILKDLLKSDPNLKVVVKELPILGPGSLVSAAAGLSVFSIAPEKYLPFHFKMFETDIKSEQDIYDVAKDVGIDQEKLVAEMKNPAIHTTLRKITALASDLGISGTPAYVIDGYLYPGALTKSQLVAAIKKVRDNKQAALSSRD